MLEILNELDSNLLLFFNHTFHCAFMDRFIMLFTGKWVWVPMYATIPYILFKGFGWKKGLVFTIAVILSIVFADQVCAHLLRPIFQRLRPAHPENPLSAFVTIVDGYRSGRYGFPSCHGANSFALATIMSLIVRRKSFVWFIMLWAAFNSYTRLYLGVHYPGDILVGAAIGSLGAWLLYLAATRVARSVAAGPETSNLNPEPAARDSGPGSVSVSCPGPVDAIYRVPTPANPVPASANPIPAPTLLPLTGTATVLVLLLVALLQTLP